MGAGLSIALRMHRYVREISAQAWAELEKAGNPFLERAFFLALEDSGALGPEAGWIPHLIALYDDDGKQAGQPQSERLLALVPAFLKSHSWGEYVFDHHWAEAYEQAGGRYYPKLLVAVPFTPVTGPRVLLRSGLDAGERNLLRRRALAAVWEEATRLGLSGAHIDFLTETEAQVGARSGWLLRSDQQFHWENQGWDDFDDFLASLKASRRKQIRRERSLAQEGVAIRWCRGDRLDEAEIAFIHRCYRRTVRKRGGWPYLNADSFRRLFATMGERFLVTLALKEGRPIAMALHALGGDTLYGRYWGALETRPFLHFELCYYQAIEWAIRHRIARVEAGAQGAHKIQRGYAPRATWSLHRFADPRMQEAVSAYLAAERQEVALARRLLARHLPFRRGGMGQAAPEPQ